MNMNMQKNYLFDSMINGEFLNCEEALKLAGDSHFYQKRTAFILALQYLFVSFVFQFLMFFLIPPDFNCKSYDAKSFELYCSNEYLKSTCQTLFFTFSNCAILFFSFFSDLKGRKPIMILTYAIGAVALLIAAFAEDIYWFMVSITVAGVGINPYSSLSFILIYESSGERFGQLSNVALLATFGLGQLIFIFISTRFRSYQVLMLYFIAIPIIIQIVGFRWIFESPQFLVVKKDFIQAKKVIQMIAKINGRSVGEFTFVEEGKYEKEIKRRIKSKLDEVKASDDEMEKPGEESCAKIGRASTLFESKHKNQNDVVLFHKTPIFERQMLRVYTFLDLAKNKEQFIPMLVLSILYFCLYLTYYGALISTPVLGDVYYFNALAQSSAELFGYVSANLFIGLLQRKLALIILLSILSLSCLFPIFITDSIAILIFGMIVRYCVAFSLSIITVYSNEIYPPAMRSLGIGLNTFLGKFGCSISPMLVAWFQFNLHLSPLISFSLCAIVAAISSCFLKETKKASERIA